MKRVTVEQIAQSASEADLASEATYLVSYREFVRYFAELSEITFHHFIIGTHFTYGWMPTILNLKGDSTDFDLAVQILNAVKRGLLPPRAEALRLLQSIVNNSLVGVSKLLHFIRPDLYPIWDSRVYKYINGKPASQQIAKVDNYMAYYDNCREIIEEERFKSVHRLMNGKIGYEVTAFRAVELVMFVGAAKS
jgi:hypothetical protein